MRTTPLITVLVVTLLATTASATPWPVAVRLPEAGGIVVETYWNLTVGVDLPPAVETACDVIVDTTRPIARLPRASDLVTIQLYDVDGTPASFDMTLDRTPNTPRPVLRSTAATSDATEHAVRLITLPTADDAAPALVIEVTGVRLVVPTNVREKPADLGRVDAVVMHSAALLERAHRLGIAFAPRMVVLAHPADAGRVEWIRPALATALGHEVTHRRLRGRTLAVSGQDDAAWSSMSIVTPAAKEWAMPPELAAWFARKEAACRAAQEVFHPLSTRQMNHRPSNGTHTPRWNVEHMMGRELGFFSAIYANRDPELAHLDLNPRQMPPDYVAAHPDWTGEEEARQMERVIRYTRRFADRLDGLALTERPQGSPWTLERLLAQMERHWGEHTANVQDKFTLPDWPAP